MKVLTQKPVEVECSKIKFDESNPNRMRREQLESLKVSLQKYGNLHPVVIDEEYVVADGYHRVRAYLELGMKKVPAIIMHFDNDNERKICRQVMNKLHGEHDPELDIAELNKIIEYDAKQLQELLQIDQSYMDELERLQREQRALVSTETGAHITDSLDGAGLMDADPEQHHRDSYLKGNIKQITIFFNNEEYVRIMPRVQEAFIDLNVSNSTDLFMCLLEFHERWKDRVSELSKRVSPKAV
jgi:ParB-like nuclease domain